jgi:hypothetical protein
MRESDLIMRWVQQIADLFASVLSKKSDGKVEEAIQHLEEGCQSLFGIDLGLILSIDATSIRTLMGDKPHLFHLIRVLEEYASLQDEYGARAKAETVREKTAQLTKLCRTP